MSTSTRSPLRARASMTAVRVGRRLFANTPVQRWPLVTKLYQKVFAYGYGTGEILATFRGLELAVPASDTTIVPGIVGGFYEELVLDAFELLVAGADHVVDVGGNLGLYTTLAARHLPAGAHVSVYEPVSDNLRALRGNIARNAAGSAASVEVIEAAVGEEAGVLTLHLAEGNVGTHSASAANAGSGSEAASRSREVAVVSLDEDLAARNGGVRRRVDVLKIDVEGYDGHVLRGASELLAADRPALLVEYVASHLRNCGFDPDEFLDLVFANGARVFCVDDVRSRVYEASRSEIAAGATRSNLNLIALTRPDQMQALRPWIEAHRG